jgi:hypothetical protein
MAITDRANFTRAFKVIEDADGQLSFEPRHRNRDGTEGRRCPATYARTEVAPGCYEPSLWRFLQVIGDVAMTEIFPTQFSIANKKDEVI